MLSLKPVQISKIAVLAALYVALSFIPVSMFIGAGSFLSLSLIITPVIAVLLQPFEALVCSCISGFIVVMLNPGSAMFGIFTVLLPIAGAVCGSLSVHTKKGSLLTLVFLGATVLYYIYSRGSFIFWIMPHVLALLLLIGIPFLEKRRLKTITSTFISTMCEQGAMLLLAINVLQLPVIVFQVAFPLMLYERTFATIGGILIILALKRVEPNLIVDIDNNVVVGL